MADKNDLERMSFEQMKKFMIGVFRRAVPEISEEATLYFVFDRTYTFPATGEKIELKDYKVVDSDGSFWEFTIELVVWFNTEYVFVLEYRSKEVPLGYYIKHTSKTKGDPDSPDKGSL